MSDYEAYVRHSLEALRADAELTYEEAVERWFSPSVLEREARATAPARAREAVARYLPADDETRFTRGLAAYARCQDGCQDRAAGDPECQDLCRRAADATTRATPRGGHTEFTIARFVHEDARIRGGGELPAVWSAYS
ncbi:hypothetical protein [Methylobacterium sp. J-092]|uniref:hypothetical protein n=1 Tax=Methylobacterium sp. J-092 TaxID=2836667 RepID=UPI001FB947D9|nr:hypothetical protein [Methylobacterium sp. J-092]MCJ2007018.1 hypothetical protein [Methylobacterium sp. J-092]